MVTPGVWLGRGEAGLEPLRVGPEHQEVGVLEGRLGRVGADGRPAADDMVAAGAGAPADGVVARLVGEPDLAHRGGDQVGDRTVEPHRPAGEHDHSLAERRRRPRSGGWRARRRAVAQGGQTYPQVGALRRVEPAGRLVEHHQPGSPSSACASPTRRRCPPDSAADPTAAGRRARPASSTRRTSWERRLALVPLLEDGDVLEEPEGRHVRRGSRAPAAGSRARGAPRSRRRGSGAGRARAAAPRRCPRRSRWRRCAAASSCRRRWGRAAR